LILFFPLHFRKSATMSCQVARRPQVPVASRPVLRSARPSAPVESTPRADIAIEKTEVATFLCENGLGMHTATILRDGFDEMEILLAAEDTHIKSWGLKATDAACLKRVLREYQQALDSDIAVFLKQHGLEQYRAPLMQQGFTEMATLVDITEDDMRQIGLLRGHVQKLKRALREYGETLDSSTSGSVPTSGRSQASVSPSQHMSGKVGVAEHTRAVLLKSWEVLAEVGTVTAANVLTKHMRELDAEALRSYTSQAQPKDGETEDDVVRKLAVRTVQIFGGAVTVTDTASLIQHLHKVGAGFAGTGIKEGYFTLVDKASPLALRELMGDRYTADIASACSMTGDFLTSFVREGFRSVEGQ